MKCDVCMGQGCPACRPEQAAALQSDIAARRVAALESRLASLESQLSGAVAEQERLRELLRETLPSVRKHHNKRLNNYQNRQARNDHRNADIARLRCAYLDNLEQRITAEVGDAALKPAEQCRDAGRKKLLEQAREFMREHRKVYALSDEAYHRDLGLLAEFVAHVCEVCHRCHGSKLVTITNYDGNGSDADDQPCPDCKHIRELLR